MPRLTHVAAATAAAGLLAGAVQAAGTASPAFRMSIATPAPGQSLSGTVDWTARVDVGAAGSVKFLVDGNAVAVTLAPTLTYRLDTTALRDGEHRLTIRGVSADGRRSSRSSVQVSVANAPTGVAPAESTAPAIAGSGVEGALLTAQTGTWTGTAPIAYGYRWRRCDGTCQDIPGATASSYTVTAGDVGAAVGLTVTATNAAGTSTASAAPVEIADGTSPPPPPDPGTRGSLLPAAIPASTGAVFYVSPTGSDASPGTSDQPWRTLGKAAATLTAGQTALLRAGTYPEATTITRSGTSTAPITFRGAPGETAVLTGRVKVTASWVRLSGLRFVGGTAANPGDVLIYVSGGDNVEISDSELRGAGMSAIYVGDPGNGADNVQFLRNYVHDNGTHAQLDHGIYYGTGRGGLIAGNVFARNIAYGVQIYPNADNVVLTQNTIVANGKSGVVVGGESTTSDGNLIVDNVIASNREGGIRAYWGGPVGTGNVARGNVLWNGSGDLPTGSAAAGIAFVDNLSANPLFASPAADDYRLQAGSPAVDRGAAGASLETDLVGATRPAGAAPDAGAYERG